MGDWTKFRRHLAAAMLGSATFLAATSVASYGEDTIRIVSPYQATMLDPMRTASVGNIEVYGLLYSRLLRRNAETGELEPALAESWEVSEDGLTYVFHLREAQFSDGSPVTAGDVVFSLERIRGDDRSAYPAPLASVESIEATDDATVTIRLAQPFAPFLGNIEIWNMGIVSKADIDARGEEAAFAAPLSSGPYVVSEWKPNERITLAPNPNYWREGYPKSDAQVALIEASSPETRMTMLKAGEVDVVRDVPWVQVDGMATADGIDMRLEPTNIIQVILLNHAREPFSSMDARRAAGHAVDAGAITAAVTAGKAQPANTTLPGSIDFHDKDNPGIAHDPARARELLDQSGMTGKEVRILAVPEPAAQQMALLIQAQWQAIGLNPVIVNVDRGAWWDALGKGDYDAASTWWYNETSDPDLAVRWALCGTCGSDSFSTHYENPEVDRLVEAGAAEQDPDKRAEIYREIQRITVDEVSQIPLYYPPYANAYSTRIKGLELTPAVQWTLEEAELTD